MKPTLRKKQMRERQRKEGRKQRVHLFIPSHPWAIRYAQSCFNFLPLPPPKSPHIRSFVPSPCPSSVVFYDRKYKEWMRLYKEWQVPSYALDHGYGKAIQEAFYASQRQRWLARCYFRKLRMSIARRRSPIEDDLGTCAPIPPSARVTVYDFRNRSLYAFHWQTILKTFLSALTFSQYGISQPMNPKNPYNNIPWSRSQLISIVSQMAQCSMNCHKFLPDLIMQFRHARYIVNRFANEQDTTLRIQAAENFFSNKEDADVNTIYNEVVEDLYHNLNATHIAKGFRMVQRIVKEKRLYAALQAEWDKIVIASWVYENYNILLHEFYTYEDLLTTFQRLHHRTYTWYRMRRRSAATATADSAATDATVVSDSSTTEGFGSSLGSSLGPSLDSSGVAADVPDSASIPVSNTVTIEFGENRVLIVTSNGAADPSALLMDVLRQCAEAEAEAAEDADANSVASLEE